MKPRAVGVRSHYVVLVLVCAGIACAGIACGSDARAPFESSPPSADGGSEGDAGPGQFGDASSEPPGTCPERIGTPGLAGCRFMVTNMTAHGFSEQGINGGDGVVDGCLALLVSNVSPEPVRLRLRFEGRDEDAAPFAGIATVNGRDVTYSPLPGGVVEPGQTALIAASRYFVHGAKIPDGNLMFCPFDAFVVDAKSSVLLGRKVTSAIELLASAPVLVSQAFNYMKDARPDPTYNAPGATVGGTLVPVVPVEAWETAPVDTGVFKPGMPATLYNPRSAPGTEFEHAFEFPTLPARTVIASGSDGTVVQAPQPAGGTAPLHLDRGQLFAYDTADAFIGRTLAANHPIGLSTSAPTPLIPWEFAIGAEQDSQWNLLPSLPAGLWGSEYVAVRHVNRWPEWPERPPWRLIGGADGITLTYEPYRPDGAPDHLRRGELAVFFADEPFVVRSQDPQHPFFLGAHMTGSNHQKQRFGDADPFDNQRGSSVATFVMASRLWQTSYPFFALPRIPEHDLVVVRRKGGADVRLDCAGTLEGWEPVGTAFEFVRVPLTGHLFEPITYRDGTCHAGAHWIESAEPFTGTLWGWGNSDTAQELLFASQVAYAVPLHSAQVTSPTPER